MARELSPAFQFYPDDWLSSSSVGAMTAEQRGCYINLLCYCWRDGAIPDDDAVLASLCRVTVKRWRAIKEGVLKPFQRAEAGWVNTRLEEERQKQAHNKALRSEAKNNESS